MLKSIENFKLLFRLYLVYKICIRSLYRRVPPSDYFMFNPVLSCFTFRKVCPASVPHSPKGKP